MNAFSLRLLCQLYGLVHARQFQYSRPVEGNFGTMDFAEKLWWGYKYYGHPVEKAEKGKHIEEYFAGQDLSFHLPEAFVQQTSAVLTAGGDLLSSNHIRPDNIAHLWDDIHDYYFGSDLAVANLETPFFTSGLAGNPPTGMQKAPSLNGSLEMLRVFTGDGSRIRFFSTANNHCLDQGEQGLRDTLDLLDAESCGHVGTARSPEEREDIPIVILNGIRVAFLSYTFSINGHQIPEGKEYLANYVRLNRPDCDISMIMRHVHTAKEKRGADVVVACLHWSLEFESYPLQNVMDMGHRLMRCGIDVILGNHPHVVQPMERYRFTDPFSSLEKDGFIVYALGDFVSYLEIVRRSMLGNLVRLKFAKGIEKGQSITRIADFDFMPIYHDAHFENERCTDFRLLNFLKLLKDESSFGRLDTKTQEELKQLQALADKLFPMKQAASAFH